MIVQIFIWISFHVKALVWNRSDTRWTTGICRRLKPGGGGVNAAIFLAGGEAFEIASKEQADTISPGSSIIVPVPKASTLYQREGVTHVIHVLGPNMNPQRPNYLKDDYVKGCKVLYGAYSSLFNNFSSIALSQNYQKDYRGHSKSEPFKSVGEFFESAVESQSSISEQTSKRGVLHGSDSNKKCACNSSLLSSDWNKPNSTPLKIYFISAKCKGDLGSLSQGFVYLKEEKSERTDHSAKSSWGSWAHALHQVAMHPEKHNRDVIEISDDFVVINDLYSKVCGFFYFDFT